MPDIVIALIIEYLGLASREMLLNCCKILCKMVLTRQPLKSVLLDINNFKHAMMPRQLRLYNPDTVKCLASTYNNLVMKTVSDDVLCKTFPNVERFFIEIPFWNNEQIPLPNWNKLTDIVIMCDNYCTDISLPKRKGLNICLIVNYYRIIPSFYDQLKQAITTGQSGMDIITNMPNQISKIKAENPSWLPHILQGTEAVSCSDCKITLIPLPFIMKAIKCHNVQFLYQIIKLTMGGLVPYIIKNIFKCDQIKKGKKLLRMISDMRDDYPLFTPLFDLPQSHAKKQIAFSLFKTNDAHRIMDLQHTLCIAIKTAVKGNTEPLRCLQSRFGNHALLLVSEVFMRSNKYINVEETKYVIKLYEKLNILHLKSRPNYSTYSTTVDNVLIMRGFMENNPKLLEMILDYPNIMTIDLNYLDEKSQTYKPVVEILVDHFEATARGQTCFRKCILIFLHCHYQTEQGCLFLLDNISPRILDKINNIEWSAIQNIMSKLRFSYAYYCLKRKISNKLI
tara:strand:- start:7648 stop:9171 length:1524 start_codon:yes stop_codon:yes gene_type:complete